MAIAQNAADAARHQLDVAKNMLESDVYSIEEYLERKRVLTEKIASAEAEASSLRSKASAMSTEDAIRAILPQVRAVLEAWPHTSSPQEQNVLLRSVLSRIDYTKTHTCRRAENARDFLTISLYPLL